MSDTNQQNSLPNGYTTDASNYLDNIKYSVDQHYQNLGTEIDKLEILKSVFTERRVYSNNIEKEIEFITLTTQSLKDSLTDHISSLDTEKLQLDQIYIERSANYDILTKELSTAKLQTTETQNKFSTEKDSLDKQMSDEMFNKEQQIQELMEKINKAKWDLQKERRDVRRLENEFDCFKNTSDSAQDFIDEISVKMEAKYDPNDLKRAEEENLILKERLAKLEQNKDVMAKAISNVDDDIYKLNKQKQQLDEHDGYNLMLKFERDEIKDLVDLSIRRQKDLYDDNIEKLRQIKEIEYEILNRDKDILDLVAQSSINGLKESLTTDLQERLKVLEREINSVDKGTNKLDRDINSINLKLVNPKYNEKLENLLTKVQNLNSRNTQNSYTKDSLKTDVNKLELDLSNIDASTVTITEIDEYKTKLTNLEHTLSSSETLNSQHIEELKNLNSDFDKIKSEIIEMLEKKFKETQQKDGDLLILTDKNSKSASAMIDGLDDKIQPYNPHMRKFVRKLNDAKALRDQVNYEDNKNKGFQKEQAERPISGSDYFAFLYRLSHDQDELDDEINNNKNRSDDLLNALNELITEFEEANFQKKDEIIQHCRSVITLRLDEYPDLEEKMKLLEHGVEELNILNEQTLKVFDKTHPDYAEIQEINEGLLGLNQDTNNLRSDKTKISNELQRLNQFLNRPDLRELSMNDILKFQKD